MQFIDSTHRLYPRVMPVLPAIDPSGANSSMFLLEHHGAELTQKFMTRNYSIEMAPIRVGQESVSFNLMSNSNMMAMVMAGEIDVSATISPDFYISTVYIEIMGELFAIDVSREAHAKGMPILEGDTRGVNIRLGKVINVNREVRTYFGEKPYWMPLLEAEEHSIFAIEFSLNGTVQIECGKARFSGDIHDVVMGGAPNQQSKFAKVLKESTKVVAFAFKATVA